MKDVLYHSYSYPSLKRYEKHIKKRHEKAVKLFYKGQNNLYIPWIFLKLVHLLIKFCWKRMTFLQLLQPHNHNITWTHHQERVYSELPETYVAIILSIINFGVLCLGLVVTRAVYKLLNRLGKRYINQIIYPSIVSYHIGGLEKSQFFS